MCSQIESISSGKLLPMSLWLSMLSANRTRCPVCQKLVAFFSARQFRFADFLVLNCICFGRWKVGGGRKMWKTNYYLMLHDRFAVRGALVWACTVSCVLWEERRNGRVKVLMMLHVLFKSFRLDVHSIRCAPCFEGLSRNWWWFRSCLSSIVGGEFKKWSCLLGVCFLLVMYM